MGSVFLAGSSVSMGTALADVVRQLDASIECFATCRDFLQRLKNDECSLLIVDMDGNVANAVVLLRASRTAKAGNWSAIP